MKGEKVTYDPMGLIIYTDRLAPGIFIIRDRAVQKPRVIYTKSRRQQRRKAKHRLFFHNIRCAFSSSLSGYRPAAPDLYQYLIPFQSLRHIERGALRNHVILMRSAGMHTQVKQLNEQIPAGYIGLMKYWSGGRLKYQRYLKLQVADDERERILHEELHSRTPLTWPESHQESNP